MERSERHMNHVVLADDDLDHGILFKMILNEVDPTKTLTIVKNGEELMEYLSEQVPDLLFLDLKMPCKDGLTCLSEIRNSLGLIHLPIVVYSQSTHIMDIRKCFHNQANLYMVKPFNSFQLRSALETIISVEWRKKYTDFPHYYMNNRFVPFTA